MRTQTGKSKSNIAGQGMLECPHCGSDKIWRIQRSVPEKIIYNVSGDKYAAKKFHCRGCHNTFLVHKDGKQPQATTLVLHDGMENLINCSKCHLPTLTIGKISYGEMILHQKEVQKTPFRKLHCFHCGNETVIYKEDYDRSNRNEI